MRNCLKRKRKVDNGGGRTKENEVERNVTVRAKTQSFYHGNGPNWGSKKIKAKNLGPQKKSVGVAGTQFRPSKERGGFTRGGNPRNF